MTILAMPNLLAQTTQLTASWVNTLILVLGPSGMVGLVSLLAVWLQHHLRTSHEAKVAMRQRRMGAFCRLLALRELLLNSVATSVECEVHARAASMLGRQTGDGRLRDKIEQWDDRHAVITREETDLRAKLFDVVGQIDGAFEPDTELTGAVDRVLRIERVSLDDGAQPPNTPNVSLLSKWEREEIEKAHEGILDYAEKPLNQLIDVLRRRIRTRGTRD